MAVKEESEIGIIKRASNISLEIYSKVFKEHMKDVIDQDKVISCILL